MMPTGPCCILHGELVGQQFTLQSYELISQLATGTLPLLLLLYKRNAPRRSGKKIAMMIGTKSATNVDYITAAKPYVSKAVYCVDNVSRYLLGVPAFDLDL